MFASAPQYQLNQSLFKSTDVFLVSYPRSGNTWVRLLLSDVLLQLHGVETRTGGNIIPDPYKQNVESWDKDNRIQLPFRIIKSHEPYTSFYKKVIYIFRNPLDCLVSLYYYHLRYDWFREEMLELDKFCIDRVGSWCQHVNIYMEAKERDPSDIIFVSYEKLHSSPIEVVRFIVELLGWQDPGEVCQRAVNNQTFGKVKQLSKLEDSKQMGFWEDEGYQNFFRKGKVDSSYQELSTDVIRNLEAQALGTYRKAKSFEPVFSRDFLGEVLYKKVLRGQQNHVSASAIYLETAKKLQREGKFADSINRYNKAIELNPSAWAYNGLGESLVKLGHWPEAINAYCQAISLNPKTASFHYKLAEILSQQGSKHEALTHYQCAVELSPKHSLFRRKLENARLATLSISANET
ncbi:MAG: sulfotransferase domain-containing protein [Microcoleaceae cyanobacterium]